MGAPSVVGVLLIMYSTITVPLVIIGPTHSVPDVGPLTVTSVPWNLQPVTCVPPGVRTQRASPIQSTVGVQSSVTPEPVSGQFGCGFSTRHSSSKFGHCVGS